MPLHRIVVILIIVPWLVSAPDKGRADQPKKLTDEEISRLLVGTWQAEASNGKGTITRHKDGTYEGKVTITNGEQTRTITFSGVWKVSEGVIVSKTTKSSAQTCSEKGASARIVYSPSMRQHFGTQPKTVGKAFGFASRNNSGIGK